MTPRASLFIGAITTGLFLVVGISLLIEGRSVLGGVVTGLGVLRGLLWARQLAASREIED